MHNIVLHSAIVTVIVIMIVILIVITIVSMIMIVTVIVTIIRLRVVTRCDNVESASSIYLHVYTLHTAC